LLNVRLAPGADWKSNAAMQQAITQVEAELADQGRVLIRASGTEPVVRVMVEARDAQVAKASAERIAQTLQ
jgi:phosphoglucosamine mutase